jgi:cytochrome c553
MTGWEIGLLATAVVFIILALVASMVVPRRWPEFPGRALGWFVAGCIVLFVGQMTAVILMAEVGEEHEAIEHTETGETDTEPEPTQPEPTDPEPTEPEPTEPTTGETETTPPPPPSGGEGDPAAGKEVFVGAGGCGSCHTFADAGTTGSIGPNLDESQPSLELAVDRVTNGQGAMPAFEGQLSEQQILDVATYVSTPGG